MGEHIVIQAILGQNIGREVLVVGMPVVGQLFGAEHQHGFVAQLIIFDDGKGSECFAEANAVGQNAAVVRLELVDQAEDRILLKFV